MPRSRFNRWPSIWENYAIPRHCPKYSQRWSEKNLIEFIQSKPHWDVTDFKNHLRITHEHSQYLVLKANRSKFLAWLKE